MWNKIADPKKKSKTKVINLLIIIVLFLGLGLLLYPAISNFVNSQIQTEIVTTYETQIKEMSDSQLENEYQKAIEYNAKLMNAVNRYTNYPKEYNSILNLTDNGQIGVVDIPKIGVHLPFYHGTDKMVLNDAIGHLEGSSFPIDGKGVHAVLVGHSGMLSRDLFTNITQLEKGDVFSVAVANRNVFYEVDQIATVLPNEINELKLDSEENYCTLITCVPYGVNSHRMLVRGHEVNFEDYSQEEVEIKYNKIETNTEKINKTVILVSVCIFLALFAILIISSLLKRKRNKTLC